MQVATRKWLKPLVIAWTLGGILAAPSAEARPFLNQFVEFQLPYNWDCGLEGTEWVCQSLDENKKRDAIIVLAAKLKGDQDTLERYQEYLSKPRSITSGPGNKPMTSQTRYSKMNKIQNHLWVDALHLESELPGFYTRYLATIEQDIAVLVTYSVNKSKFVDYQNQFDDLVRSIRVFRKPGGLLAGSNNTIFAQNTNALQKTGTIFDEKAAGSSGEAKKKTAGADDGSSSTMLLLLAAAAVGFVIWKKKRQNR